MARYKVGQWLHDADPRTDMVYGKVVEVDAKGCWVDWYEADGTLKMKNHYNEDKYFTSIYKCTEIPGDPFAKVQPGDWYHDTTDDKLPYFEVTGMDRGRVAGRWYDGSLSDSVTNSLSPDDLAGYTKLPGKPVVSDIPQAGDWLKDTSNSATSLPYFKVDRIEGDRIRGDWVNKNGDFLSTGGSASYDWDYLRSAYGATKLPGCPFTTKATYQPGEWYKDGDEDTADPYFKVIRLEDGEIIGEWYNAEGEGGGEIGWTVGELRDYNLTKLDKAPVFDQHRDTINELKEIRDKINQLLAKLSTSE